ncbi:hypothetical protein HZC53_05180 [Candidatus Uhrbacteria bacterium]|nr:hypothetical protein [Candidatus Uhrbacteria bacterium]
MFLDTARSGEFRFGYLREDGVELVDGIGRSNKILSALASHLKAQDVQDMAGVCVVAGPGSFTSVRTGVLVANLLARYWGKPLYGVSVEQAQDVERLYRELNDGKHPSNGYVAPVYDTEPNITLKASVGPKCYV